MKRKLTSLLALCAVTGFAAPAVADCEQELAELRDQISASSGEGISKDGSLAPLETSESATTTVDTPASNAEGSDTPDSENKIVQDGDVAPLETDLSNRATSGQNAQARQEGGETDNANSISQETQDALNTAQAALEAGDETACMKAVEAARQS